MSYQLIDTLLYPLDEKALGIVFNTSANSWLSALKLHMHVHIL